MQTIYKYPFEVKNEFTLAMPEGAQVLTVQLQGETPCIWAMVDHDTPMIERTFAVFGTGHPLPKKKSMYISTFQQPPFVWHLFEVT